MQSVLYKYDYILICVTTKEEIGDYMKLTVIGCWGGFPAPSGATASYLIEKDDFVLAVDMGSGALSQMQHYNSIDQLDAVILSHYHHDHVADIGVLQYAWLVDMYVTGRNNILPIYGHDEEQASFDTLTSERTKGVVYHPDESIEIGPFTITFLRTNHPVACFGMRITDGTATIVYTADSAYMDEWVPFTKGVDLLVADCNLYAHQDGRVAGHMTSKECGKIAHDAQVGQLILSHLPQYGDRNDLIAEAVEQYKGPVQLAAKGLTWKRP